MFCNCALLLCHSGGRKKGHALFSTDKPLPQGKYVSKLSGAVESSYRHGGRGATHLVANFGASAHGSADGQLEKEAARPGCTCTHVSALVAPCASTRCSD